MIIIVRHFHTSNKIIKTCFNGLDILFVARLLTGRKKRDRVTPVLATLALDPRTMQCKGALFVFKAFNALAPEIITFCSSITFDHPGCQSLFQKLWNCVVLSYVNSVNICRITFLKPFDFCFYCKAL